MKDKKGLLSCDIENFILWLTSDEEERARWKEALDEYINEIGDDEICS